MRRLFLALPLAEYFLSEIRALLDQAKVKASSVKWELPEKVHVTLHFFGPTPDSELKSICEAGADLAEQTSPFEISLNGIGFFPSPQRPRIVWLGMNGEIRKLTDLQSGLAKRLQAKGFASEARAFHPHATIGRIKDNRASIGELARLSLAPTPRRLMERIVLTQSHLESTGSRYEVLETFHFSSRPIASR